MQTAVTGPAGVPARVLSQITANSSEGLTTKQDAHAHAHAHTHTHTYTDTL
jgi:hypothetical protein